MKQNLIQKQLRLQGSKQKNNNTTIIDVSGAEGDIVDFTTKAFFIANQILENDFLFSKRALATYLYGKPIMLQQKGNERPPQSLKGYMNLYDDVLIEKLIDFMIELNILGEKRINLKQRSTKRLFTTKKFQFNTFPKVSMKVNIKRSIQFPFTMKKQKVQNERPKQKQKQKSRLSSFLFTKTSLPVNIQKKQIQLKMKTQRQREQQQQRKRRQQEQIRLKKQQQLKAIEQEKQRQLAIKRKQQQKQQNINKMNNFWLKQKQKIQSFISPSKLRSLNNKSKQQQSKRKNQQNNCLQIAGNMLHAQMKQLKEQEEQKKNPIKPFISWSFVKNTLGIDSSQSNNQKVQQKSSSFQHVIGEVKQQIMISHKKISDKNYSSQSVVNKGYLTTKKDKQQQNEFIQQKTPFLGLPISYHEVKQNDQQQHSLSFNNTQSTEDVTMTNYRLQKINKKKSKDQIYQIQKNKNKEQEIFVQSQQDSMFSNSYYSTRDKGQQTVTNKKIQKNTQSHKEKKFDENKKVKQCFTFKRTSTFLPDQQTLTVARKVNQRCYLDDQLKDFENESQNQVQQRLYKRHKRQSLGQDEDQLQHTMTLAIPKKLSQKRKTKEFLQVVFSQNIPNYEVDMFSQTNTIPQPKTKNKKISTSDLFPNKSQLHHQQKEFKRDSFVQELINDYYYRKK